MEKNEKQKRCKNGTRRNKDGICVPIYSDNNCSDEMKAKGLCKKPTRKRGFNVKKEMSPDVTLSASMKPSVESDRTLSASIEPSISPDATLSASMKPSVESDRTLSVSMEPSISPDATLTASMNPIISPDDTLSASIEPSISPDATLSASIEPSVESEHTLSTSTDPSISPDTTLSAELEPSVSPDSSLPTTSDSNIIEDEYIPSSTESKSSQNESEIDESPSYPELQDLTTDEKKNNEILFQNEKLEFDRFNSEKNTNTYDSLYPNLNDPDFNVKIASKIEFNNTKYDGKTENIIKKANEMCKLDFELASHQIFVKNFLSFQTPYNSLLLYHGLGTGKTCSAIGIAEEMRNYMKQMGITKRIIIVASPVVQGNFKTQLFDERKLKEENGLWNIESCIGNSLIQEINPTNIKGVSREKIISQIKTIINNYYVFMGYNKFANYIELPSKHDKTGFTEDELKDMEVARIKALFNNRLVIIDEIHNIRLTEDNATKRTATTLLKVAKYSDNMRLLVLSATPMYNSYREIIWLTNLLNLNDKRATILVEDVFDKDGNFQPERSTKDGKKKESGKDLLHRKLIGYISYVRGENPYVFPYRIYPGDFSPENSISNMPYPSIQMNGKPIESKIKHIPIYINKLSEYQSGAYNFIIENLLNRIFSTTDAYGKTHEMPTFENMDSFGYTLLMEPLESLNIIYPNAMLDSILAENASNIKPQKEVRENTDLISSVIGKSGLANVMKSQKMTIDGVQPIRYNFEYKKEILENYGRIFAPDHIYKYSSKISNICNAVMQSKGIVLIYSNYIDGGVIPMALALEELGFTRYGSNVHTKPLLKKPYPEPIDSITLKPKSETDGTFRQAKYVLITGDNSFSPNNTADVKYVTSRENTNGEFVKVIIISKAASEGVDLKNIRQIHILEPWYNMNRIEQIIGRGVRNLSHCGLPFQERNVEIYLHGTQLDNNTEAADLYVYRHAETKAIQIGKITRLMKEIATDCILNIAQTNFTQDKLFEEVANQNIVLSLSSGKQIPYKIGDRPYTDICDYMESCTFKCNPRKKINKKDLATETFNIEHIKLNKTNIVKRIKQVFRERVFFTRQDLINAINIFKVYPVEDIDYALTYLLNKTEHIFDEYERPGFLINRGNYYMYRPIEINSENSSIYDSSFPVDYKREKLLLELPKQFEKKQSNYHIQNDEPRSLEKSNPSIGIYEKLLYDINNAIDLIRNPNFVIKSGSTDWFEHANRVFNTLSAIHEINETHIMDHLLYYYLDTLEFENKMVLVSNIYDQEPNRNTPLENKLKEYFDKKMIDHLSKKSIYLARNNAIAIYIQRAPFSKIWEEAEPIQYEEIMEIIKRNKTPRKPIHKIIGFMHMFKDKNIVFKIKNISQKRNNFGAKCINESKGDIIRVINEVVNKPLYTEENTKSIAKVGLCVILQILMVEYTLRPPKSIQNKTYFLNPEESLLTKIVNI